MTTAADHVKTRVLQLFVSYAREDQQGVQELLKGVERLGHEVWVDQKLSGGQAWWDEILARIRGCDGMLIAVSPALLDSEASALERRYGQKLGKPLLPVIIRPIRSDLLPVDLAPLQFVDYTTPEPMTGFELAGALASLAAPAPLPDPLPDAPPVPVSYVVSLSDRVHAATLTLEEQLTLVAQLRTVLDRPDDRDAGLELLQALQRRRDLYYAAARDIERAMPEETPALRSETEPSGGGGVANDGRGECPPGGASGETLRKSWKVEDKHTDGDATPPRPRYYPPPPPPAGAPSEIPAPASRGGREFSERAATSGRRRRPRPTQTWSPLNKTVEAAVREVVTPGRIGFNPPAEMRQGEQERISVTVARSRELDDKLCAGLTGRGVIQLEDLDTSPFMTVQLRGTAFGVTPLGPERQLVTGVTLWEFDVVPLRAGRRVLQLCVCMNIRLPDESEPVAHAIPVFERNIRVRVDPVYSTRRFTSRHWKWVITTVAGLGSVIAAWTELIHGEL